MRIDFLLTMAESRGLLKILSRPRVVTQNNIQAIVKQGVRVPIVTQAQLGGPPTVSYVDAFLRLTVTPQITSEGTIFLNVDVENTTPDFGRTSAGQPDVDHATGDHASPGHRRWHGRDRRRDPDPELAERLAGAAARRYPVPRQPVQTASVKTSNQELIFFITPRIIQT